MGAQQLHRDGETNPQLQSLRDARPSAEVEARIIRGALARAERPARGPMWAGVGLAAAVGAGVLLLVLASDRPSYDGVQGLHATGDQPLDVHFDDHYVSLRPQTRLEIEAAQPGSARLSLEKGGVDCFVEPLQAGARFLVRTPQTEVEVVGTQFRVVVEGPCTAVEVFEGTVRVGEARLQSGEDTRVCAPAPTSPAAPTPPPLGEDELMRRAMDAVARGEHASAERLFQRYRVEHPNGAFVEDALFQEAFAASLRGDPERVRTLVQEMKASFPKSPRLETLEELLRK
ncbi:MAG: FecR domain-containing protein [Myxococcota bacterium]